ncbi:hypothetical protein EDB19DRAFT_2038567 [Suillus lakei]|nr:hypothetical protein EDB19DRAFT_2038567 [Suillus lakei]
MPQTHALRSVVNKSKGNRAQMATELLIRDDELAWLKVASKPSRNKKKKGSSVAHAPETDGSLFWQKALDDMRQEFLGMIGEQSAQLREQASQLSEQASRISEQASLISEQASRLSGQPSKPSKQAGKLSKQADDIKQLKASNTEITATLERHSSMLHALHRRVVLDEARDLLIDRYDFAISDLRLGGHRTAAEKQTALGELVQAVRSKLNAEDKTLLSDEALQMIFERGKNTVRQRGNDAAHNASEEDLSVAILGTGLDSSQLALLEKIYEFTHNDVPQL